MPGHRNDNARNLLAVIATSAVAVFLPSTADACKQWLDLRTYPVENLRSYDSVYVARVVSVTPLQPLAESWYSPPFKFKASILRTFKGTKKVGDLIDGATGTNEEPAARCPVFLKKGVTYLIVLNGTESPFTLPRYSAYVPSSDDVHFKRYLKDVESYYSATEIR